MSTELELPQELVDSILDYLEGDPASLRTCSLLARAWVPRSRSYLFESLLINAENILVFRDLLRSPCCTFIPHVRSISAERPHRHKNDTCFHEIAQDMRFLRNVRTLELRLSIVVDSANVDASFRTGFVAAFPNVTHLILTGYFEALAPNYDSGGEAYYSQPAPLIEMICSFPALQSLQIQELSGTVMDPPASAVPPAGLRSLNLCSSSLVPVLAWLRSFNHLPRINSLTLPSKFDTSVVRAALQQLDDLHHLDITLPRASRFFPSYTDYLLTLSDLSLHPNLRTLIIHDGSATLNLGNLISLISTLDASALERILLVADLFSNVFRKWDELDAVLASERFPYLRDFTLKHKYWNRTAANINDTTAFMRVSFPLLSASGVLRLDLVLSLQSPAFNYMPIGSELPQELVDTILDCLERDHASLKACSLVSRGWVARSRSYLFGACSIDAENILVFRELLQSPHCTFTPHVRSISAERRHTHQNDGCFNGMASDLRLLENLRSLKVLFSTDVFLRAGFMSAFPNVTHLVLTCLETYSSTYESNREQVIYTRPAPLIEMICLFRALQSLHIGKLSGILANPPANAVPPPGLRSLNLRFHSPGLILEWLQSFNQLPNVDSLTLVPSVRRGERSVLRGALQQLGGALRNLDITLIDATMNWFYETDLLALFDLSLHPNLRTLVIRDPSGTLDPRELVSLMNRLEAAAFERLLLVVDLSMEIIMGIEWDALDVFLSPERFPRLRNVTLKHGHFKKAVANIDDTAVTVFMQTSLPLLAGSGMLGLDFSDTPIVRYIDWWHSSQRI
ncbi:hypothetical protein MSAN_00187500 [Mycena sanguinolenta]|uniref:F-box domain-containing protein n=1 Tax=Mycena sanguinolenta TaxID=230812 RepID=A0A8H6ZJQ6_9AGAR|nr:hypothetical protein MSAN_00187500 [Mycena sanguinolenta]